METYSTHLTVADCSQAGRLLPEKISVCHLASGDLWAGAEVQVAALLKALAKREELAVSAILLNDGRLADEVRRCEIEVKIIPEDKKSFFQILAEAGQYLRGKQVRILHSHRYKENLLAALLAWKCCIPFRVRSQHGMPEPVTGIKSLKHGTIQLLDRVVARFGTDCIVTVSSELRDYVSKSASSARIVTIRNGIDLQYVASSLQHEQAKARLGIPEHCRVVGTAGRLEPVKRLDRFFAAATELAKRVPDVRFLVVGEGSQRAHLQNLVTKTGLEGRVLFLGFREDVYDILRAMDIFILCSDHEGLPMVLLEALSLGVLVVARSVGGIPEVISNQVNGILLRSDEPLELARACSDLLTDKTARARLAEEGIRTVRERFTIQSAAAEVSNLYRSLCEVS